MSSHRRSFLSALVLVTAGAFLSPGPLLAVGHEVRILLDLDNDASTGCDVDTVDGPFSGVEQVLITTVETTAPPPAGTVTDVAISDCVPPGTFGAPVSFDGGGWPIGIDNGTGGLDVVETYFPLVSSVIPDPRVIRLAVVVTDELGEEQALLTVDGAPGGAAIILAFLSAMEIPTLGEWGLILLALLLAGASLRLLGPRGTLAAGLVVLVGAAGTAWAAGSLDGLTNDWTAGDELGSNGIVLFGKENAGNLCFRVDVELRFNTSPTADPQSVTTPEDTPLAITLTGTDPESDPLTFTIVSGSGPDHGTLAGTPPSVTYSPDADFEGADSFDFQVEDPSGLTGTATVSITVTGVDDAPVLDFGDAPDSYGTLLESDGPRHAVVDGFSLGVSIDSENDGLPSVDADGDDNDNFDDEDGLSDVVNSCDGASLSITLTNTAAIETPRLDAWVDFDANGTFDEDERIATSLPLDEGANNVPVNVPSDVATGESFARFRLTSTGVDDPVGLAADGEVEDYPVNLDDFSDAPTC